jgi:hypothetical protein
LGGWFGFGRRRGSWARFDKSRGLFEGWGFGDLEDLGIGGDGVGGGFRFGRGVGGVGWGRVGGVGGIGGDFHEDWLAGGWFGRAGRGGRGGLRGDGIEETEGTDGEDHEGEAGGPCHELVWFPGGGARGCDRGGGRGRS